MVFIVSIAFILLKQKIKLESYKKVWEKKGFCDVVSSSEYTRTAKFNQTKNLARYRLLFMQNSNL